jgi:hypothetical protein
LGVSPASGLKIDLTEGSETSAIINQMPGKHPKVDTVNTVMSEELVASIFYSEDAGSRFVCNMGTYLPDCMTSHPK